MPDKPDLARGWRFVEKLLLEEDLARLDRRRRTAWAVGLAAAAIGAMAIVVVVEKKEVVAWFQKEPVKTTPDVRDVQKPPTPQERAAALRHEAFGACSGGLWAKCRDNLDEAKRLDPGGEGDLRVQGSRKAVEDGLHPEGGD